MKKITRKRRLRDAHLGYIHRSHPRSRARRKKHADFREWRELNRWVDDKSKSLLSVNINKKNHVTLVLPEVMNFSDNYDSTVTQIATIRKFSTVTATPRKAYRLVSVNFDNLKKISTSAALVLTAELSKWDDALRQKLRPDTDRWSPGILQQLTDLGFFDLFGNAKEIPMASTQKNESGVTFVKYIKGRCGDSVKARHLKAEVNKIVGDNIKKWNFLHGGLTEAITNVTHHAYPEERGYSESDKNWYLTGSFNRETSELKIVFYDQGVGIPKSLPSSAVWEKVLSFLEKLPMAQRKHDEVLLKAAVQLDRTRTGENDRGKGLQDLLEFIRQRGDGYLSIMSLKGLYKLSVTNGVEKVKSEGLDNPICGTLIIWDVNLTG